MFKFLKHITPKTKILFVAFILVLLPGAIISYLSLQSIKEKAENLRTKYTGTVNLVRDKLENETSQFEENLRTSVIEFPPESDNSAGLKTWIKNKESDNPAVKNLFFISTKGDLITSSVSLGWNDQPGTTPVFISGAAENFSEAEKAEFIDRNLTESIRLYKEALDLTSSAGEHALLLSRTGRCFFKLGEYRDAINEYTKILDLENKTIKIGNVPASVIALSQIADCYEALKADKELYISMLELHGLLLDQPWDLAGGDYLYYLNSVSKKIHDTAFTASNVESGEFNIEDLFVKEANLLEKTRFVEFIDKDILPEILTEFRKGSPSELRSNFLAKELMDTTFQLSYFRLPAAFQKSHLLGLGYQLDKDYILSVLFPRVLSSVELGKDILVGILDRHKSLLYIQNGHRLPEYLVTASLSKQFDGWEVALFDPDGKSIEQLTGKEKQLYLVLFAGIMTVMLTGIILIIRAVMHESEISRLKSEFVSNVSHELKTPLALIRMFGETLDSGIVTEEKSRRKFYSIIRKESERLTHLINNVLDFSRMDTGAKEYNFIETDLVDLVGNSIEAYNFQISNNGFKIENEMPDESINLKIDRDAISQVLLNLLNNAVKYSDKEKYIGIKVSKNSDFAMISVTDHGIGISKEELKKIFDKFYRVSTSRTRETRGSGLGLTLAKHIIEAHGGTIEVESEVGEGSRFTISIPLIGS
jgi:signal transduction histidine kinase